MNKKTLCLIQQRKIFFYTIVTAISVVLFAIINITIINRNSFVKQIITQKKNDLQKKKTEISKIDKTIKFIEKEQINVNLEKKYGFYSSFDKQEFLNSIVDKMNDKENDIISQGDVSISRLNDEYSSFSIKIVQPSKNNKKNKNINDIIDHLKSEMVINDNQKIDFSIEKSTLLISFRADYEYVVYRILTMMKQILPGYVVVKSLTVRPAREELRRMLYIKHFDNQNDNFSKIELDNRLNCSIELEWIYLAHDKAN